MSCETDLSFRLPTPEESDPDRIPPWSARGCTQTLTLLTHHDVRRTVNGDLVDISSPFHRKYISTISCRDKTPLAFDGVWIGTALWVNCIQCLTTPFAAGVQQVALARKPVKSSLTIETIGGEKIRPHSLKEKTVFFEKPLENQGFITYQPQLLMRLTDSHLETDEWGMVVGWKMQLEEV